MIDAYAEWPHFVWHLLPIWDALPADARGTFYAPRHICARYPDVGLVEGLPARDGTAPVLVAGFGDAHQCRPRPVVLVNHGAGQTYTQTRSPESFSGGPGRDRVILHLEPGPLAARASKRAGYPYVEVGVPAMDPWHQPPTCPFAESPVVAVALHHNGRGAPEQMSAWTHYEAAFAELAACVDVVGHGHPRGWERTRNKWHAAGVTTEESFARVLDTASLLVTDISSVGPLFASTGRPVVWISAPWHTAAPESGGRFHDWTRAVEEAHGHVTDPADLADTVQHHLFHPSRLVAAQRAIVDDVFYACDGHAAERAADAIVQVL